MVFPKHRATAQDEEEAGLRVGSTVMMKVIHWLLCVTQELQLLAVSRTLLHLDLPASYVRESVVVLKIRRRTQCLPMR